jgi:hypothetical protein
MRISLLLVCTSLAGCSVQIIPSACNAPPGQPAGATCCVGRGSDACAAGLACSSSDNMSGVCVSTSLRSDGDVCNLDAQCVSASCNLAVGRCRSSPGATCTGAVGCGFDNTGQSYRCDASSHVCLTLAPPPTETASPLGGRALTGYHVRANASATIPDGDIGYLITSNGTGGWRIAWVDTANSPAQFQGTVTTDTAFDPQSTFKLAGTETVTFTSTNRIDFGSVPGATVNGVDFAVTGPDVIYVDLTVEGGRSGFGIFFTGATTGQVLDSPDNPVAFTSP